MKNKKVMSLAIKPEIEEELKRFARRKSMSASAYIGNLLEQALKLSPDDEPTVIGKSVDEDIITVMLKIPAALKTNPEQLQKWLSAQSEGIVKAFAKTNES